VLDEADRMLDMGFEKDVRAIIGMTSPTRRTMMFTATWPDSVEALANEFLSKPIRINVGSFDLTANKRVTQTVEVIDESNKPKRLKELLQKYVCLRLSGSGLRPSAFHGL
jgi:ATP-dependent RNA helicase DBP3